MFGSFELYKTPRTDVMYAMDSRESLGVIHGALNGLIRRCIPVGHTPAEWRKTGVVFIPTSERIGYPVVKDYRSISLTSLLLKVPER